jgi:cytochrome c551/c552
MNKRPFILLATLTLGLCAIGAGLKIELPAEKQVYKAIPGAGLANARCLTCHSVDYIVIQPPWGNADWKKSVIKMQQKYGADIPEGEFELLADYLARAYGTDQTNSKPLISPVTKTESGLDGSKLVARFACLSCHNVDKKIVGPSFKDISKKYKLAPDAYAKLARQINLGGGGNWGPIPMPPFPQVSAADVKTISDWILKQ